MLFCIVDILGATHLSSGILMFMSYYGEQFVRGVQNKENSDGKATWFRKNGISRDMLSEPLHPQPMGQRSGLQV